jgi:hypothetical protein
MVSDAYEAILSELSEALKIPALKPDPNNSCLIRLESGLEVQIEPDTNLENLLIGTNIAQVPPGAFRTNVFKEALKHNALPPPTPGTFAWSRKADQLVLFTDIPMKNLTGAKVAELLIPFAATAIKWGEALKAGQVPRIEIASSASTPSSGGLFGLQP